MAKNFAFKCAKSGHRPDEDWEDVPQQAKGGTWFVTHICRHCKCLYAEKLPKDAIGAIYGSDGARVLVGEQD